MEPNQMISRQDCIFLCLSYLLIASPTVKIDCYCIWCVFNWALRQTYYATRWNFRKISKIKKEILEIIFYIQWVLLRIQIPVNTGIWWKSWTILSRQNLTLVRKLNHLSDSHISIMSWKMVSMPDKALCSRRYRRKLTVIFYRHHKLITK